ncbi:MAG TPA: family 78 glycoside hydrolase catalytic domain [Streptosporangiaceae bacterium]|nr:family 78 glycoside hydrolase catalytic domain [Streptosporangiaceae bacterium]
MPPLTPAGLRCAYLVNPLGVAPERIALSWELQGEGRDRRQSGYQVQVAAAAAGTAPSFASPVWDSGRVDSADCTGIGYDGPPLAAGGRCAWRVRAFEADQAEPAWSEPAWFETELDPAGWQGAWIGRARVRESFTPPTGAFDPMRHALHPAPYLRRPFSVDGPVAAARLHITALGLYEARLNGQRIGDAVLAPGWTDYARRIPYQTYDVTALLQPGDNVLAAVLGDGWYAGFVGFDAKRAGAHYGQAPELLAQLVITRADGSTQVVVTDGQWQASSGAIRRADLLMGEQHDLAREPHGWDRAGFDAAGWARVRCRDRDATPLVADPGPPVRVTQEIAAREIISRPDGTAIADFGQNLTGWVRIAVNGPAGAGIRVRHAEVLNPDGSLYTENLRTARQVDEYVTAGGAEVLEPRLTIHGFRYAEISGYPGGLRAADVVARVAHSDIESAGSFESPVGWLNQLYANIDWGQRGNFISVPTDCPQRDERLGWLGDAQIFVRTACYNRDVAAFFAKWMDDVTDAQLPSGAFPDIAPRLHLDWGGAPAWADAGIIVPWTLHQMYGDTTSVRRHYGAMTAYMDFLARANPDYLRAHELGHSYNDWLAPGGDDKTPHELLATAYWAHDAALMAEIADVIGRPEDAAGYRELRARIGSAFADAFVTAGGEVTSGTQTAYVLGLHMGLIPGDLRAAAARHLVAAIEAAGWRLSTGFVGVGYLLPVLSAAGYTDVAYRLLAQDALPSWRYMIDNGATTIWERWDGWSGENGFQSPQMNSFNHYSLGSVGEWLYRFVLGIDLAPDGAGFRRLVMRPHPGGQLRQASGGYRSVRGPVTSQWQHDGGSFTYRVTLPPNVTASVRVPSRDAAAVRDGQGREPDSIAAYPGAPGAQEAVFEIGSGSHEFTGPALAADPAAAGAQTTEVAGNA